jgi:hypothetical protein
MWNGISVRRVESRNIAWIRYSREREENGRVGWYSGSFRGESGYIMRIYPKYRIRVFHTSF